MGRHDIIVIGASAGGVEALIALARALPADLPATLFVTLHLPASGPSLLPEILSNSGPLPALHPRDRTPVARGHIYIAPPDHHLVLEDSHVHVVRGPKENGFRPAIDALFRTAARAYGSRVAGVILTGMLDDGTAGLLAVKRHGGFTIVQDPHEATYPSMPESALRYVSVDRVCALHEIAPLLVQGAQGSINAIGGPPMSDAMELEANISSGEQEALDEADALGTLAPFSCPDCGGVLMEFYDGDLLRFRCQVGHAYSRESALARQADQLDRELWAAYRALDEREQMLGRLAQDAQRFHDHMGERRFRRLGEQAAERKEQVRLALLKDDSADNLAGELAEA
jgi:two-component system, chemotaxis family, protein-glutamate methylesterase/glutaminase